MRVSDQIRQFCKPFLALDEEGQAQAGYFAIEQGRNRSQSAARKRLEPVQWVDARGNGRGDDLVIEEASRKIERVRDDDPGAFTFLCAYYRSERKPSDFLAFEPDGERVGGHLDAISEQAKQHGAGVQALALANMNVELLNAVLSLNDRLQASVRDTAEKDGELKLASLLLQASDMADGSADMDRAWDMLEKVLTPEIFQQMLGFKNVSGIDNAEDKAKAAREAAQGDVQEPDEDWNDDKAMEASVGLLEGVCVELNDLISRSPGSLTKDLASRVLNVLRQTDQFRATLERLSGT